MRCFVISLPQAVERRARIATQLQSLGVEFSFLDAVDLRHDRNRYFHHCDERRFLLNTGRTPATGELSCFASHRLLWRTCRVLDEPVVVLEDDADLDPAFAVALPFVARHVTRLGFVRLQDPPGHNGAAVARWREHRIDFGARVPHGSLAYALSPRAAGTFIAHSEVVTAPVDVFIRRYWRHGQPLFAVRPGIARAGPLAQASGIDRQAAPRAWDALARRWLHKRRDEWQRAWFNGRWRLPGAGDWPENRAGAVVKSDS